MLSSLESTDFNSVILSKADKLIKKDRMRFEDVYRITEEYCKNNKIIVSDVNALLGNKSNKEFSYKLHCEYPYKHAVHLSNQLHSNVGEWVKMKTVVGHQEFLIEYDMRPIISIYGLDIQKNVDLHDIILPVKINDILYMSPEIEIIDVYHKLYSPESVEDWENLVQTEEKLFVTLKQRIKDGIFGGSQKENKRSPEEKTDIQYLKYLVLSGFCSEYVKDYVVIGHWASHVIDASKEEDYKMKSSVEKLQVITTTDIEKSIEDVTNFLSKYTNAKISSRKQDLHIPKDFRTKRYTIYIGIKGKKGEIVDKAFMDIFDCGTFELIPYVPISLKTKYGSLIKDVSQFNRRGYRNRKGRRGGDDSKEFIIKVGNPFVLLRFLVIDLWIIRMIHEMGHLTNDMLKLKTKYIMYVVEKIKDPKFGLMDKAFDTNYVGNYKDYDISKKIENLKGRGYYPYYPERELLNNDQYKNIV